MSARLAALGLLFCSYSSPAAAFSLEEIVPGIWVHLGVHEVASPENQGDLANLTAVIGDDGIAVIDTGGSRAVGEAFRDALSALSGKPVLYVINTHAHPDHVLGNAAFAGAEFVGHAGLPRALADRGETYLRNMARLTGPASGGNQIIAPSLLVDGEMVLDLGGRELRLKTWQTAHTNADLSVFDSQTSTLIAGDLLFLQHIPALDGSLNGWIDVLEDLAGVDADLVVPGHGSVIRDWPEAMEPQLAYLNGLRADLRAAIGQGEELSEVSESLAIHGGPWLLSEEFHVRNVIAGYTELEWE